MKIKLCRFQMKIKKSVLQSAVVKTDTGQVVKIDDANGNSLLDF